MCDNNLINLARAIDSIAEIPSGAGYEADMRTALMGDLRYGTLGVVDNIRDVAPRYGYTVVEIVPTDEHGCTVHFDLREAGTFVVWHKGEVLATRASWGAAQKLADELDAIVIDVTETVRKNSF